MKGSEAKMMEYMDGASKRYVIPVYQRKYDWKEDNCRQLYEDLKKIVFDKRDSHFFGSIVSSVIGSGATTEYHIIDGQQRLTTVTLLLLAIRNLIQQKKITAEEPQLDEQINERFLISKWAKEDDRIKLRPVKSDREALVKLFGDEEDYDQSSNLTLNYKFFCNMLLREEISVDDLYAAIGKLEIISITLDQGDNAQLIFESLNSTGLALTEGDKIRNYILMGLPPKDQNKYYDNYWAKIEKCTDKDVSGFIRDYLSVKQQITPTISNVYRAFKAYAENARLSQADRDLMVKENKAESESISHQKALIQNFISGDPELAECEQYEFFDDGYSGTNFERPSFERLLEKIKNGAINCVIVKDFSRFGRDYIELGDYLERIFPFLGVRFISINDHYDSQDYKGTTGGLDVVMKNIVYDYYSKDLSVKVTTAKRAKMKRGEYIGGHVPYGLKKDPDDYHKLAVDPEAAAVVREIFEAAIDGMRISDIARMLNEKGYETPARYFQRKHPEKKKFENTSELACWNHNSVRRILKQEMYYGAVVGHKREGIGVGWKHSVAVPKEEQVIVENKHPGIITKEEFIKAQKIFRENRATKRVTEKDYPLWRKVKCGTCGRAMPFKDRIIRGRPYRYFACPHAQAQVGENGCSKEYIREDVLNGVVWESIKTLLAAADGVKEQVKQKQKEADQNNTKLVKKLAKLQKDREKCDAERFANVDQFMAGTLDKEVYQSRRADLTRKADRLDAEIAELEAKYHEAEVIQDDGVQNALEMLDMFSDITELDQDIVGALIEKVLVYDPRHVEIRWKFSDEVMKLLQG